jgi:hypothetical protein
MQNLLILMLIEMSLNIIKIMNIIPIYFRSNMADMEEILKHTSK